MHRKEHSDVFFNICNIQHIILCGSVEKWRKAPPILAFTLYTLTATKSPKNNLILPNYAIKFHQVKLFLYLCGG